VQIRVIRGNKTKIWLQSSIFKRFSKELQISRIIFEQ